MATLPPHRLLQHFIKEIASRRRRSLISSSSSAFNGLSNCHPRFFSSSTIASSSLRQPTSSDVTYFRSILNPNQIITTLHHEGDDCSSSNSHNDKAEATEALLHRYNIDWTNRYHGQSTLLLKPSSTHQVSSILSYCHSHHLPVVTQGGNTSLCGGATPSSDSNKNKHYNEIILSMEGMNRIHSFNTFNGILVADAGCLLQTLQEYTSSSNNNNQHLFPLDIGSKGSCQIGGNVSTNAGGGYFYRFGGLHSTVVGMEVVLPEEGKVLRLNLHDDNTDDGDENEGYNNNNNSNNNNNGRKKYGCHRKDNTGYDLKHLFIGAEGTLGVITKVAVACPPLPSSKNAALLVCDSYSKVLRVLNASKRELGEILSAMELMDWQTLSLVRQNHSGGNEDETAMLLDEMLAFTTCREATTRPLYLLVETQGSNSEHDNAKMNTFLEQLYESSIINNGYLATDSRKMNSFWNIREGCNPSVARSGYVYKYDVSVPIEEYMEIAAEVEATLLSLSTNNDKSFLETKVCVWGHLADGNAHINVVTPGVFQKDETLATLVDDAVYGSVLKRRGSISAEHGIGQSKVDILEKIKDESVMNVMVQMKRLFDPHGIMNLGKVLHT